MSSQKSFNDESASDMLSPSKTSVPSTSSYSNRALTAHGEPTHHTQSPCYENLLEEQEEGYDEIEDETYDDEENDDEGNDEGENEVTDEAGNEVTDEIAFEESNLQCPIKKSELSEKTEGVSVPQSRTSSKQPSCSSSSKKPSSIQLTESSEDEQKASKSVRMRAPKTNNKPANLKILNRRPTGFVKPVTNCRFENNNRRFKGPARFAFQCESLVIRDYWKKSKPAVKGIAVGGTPPPLPKKCKKK